MNPDIFNTLSDMLNKSKTIKNTYNSTTSNSNGNINPSFFSMKNDFKNDLNNSFDFSNIDIETIMKFKKIMTKMSSNSSSPRSNLLQSLKPYLKDSRKQKIDQYIQLMNIASIFEELNTNSGGDIK